MAPDTPRRHLHAVPDASLPEYPPIDTIPGLAPKPPSRRGWYTHVQTSTPIEVPHSLFVDVVNSLRHYDHLVDPRADDATFENETRPHR